MALPSHSAAMQLNRSPPVSFTYADAVRAFHDQNIQADLAQACDKLARTTTSLVSRFDNISMDSNRSSQGNWEALRPRWNDLRKDFQLLMLQTRTNASFISERLKMFSTNVLPIVARNANSPPSRKLIDEKYPVISSYLTVSTENANMTRSLAGKTLQFCSSLRAFQLEVSRHSRQRISDEHKELENLSRKLSDLDSTVHQICAANVKLASPDVSYMVFSIYRIITSTLRRPGRSKVCQKQVSLGRQTAAIGNLYEQLEQTQNQVAIAQYAFESRKARTDAVVGEVATLLSDVLLTTESVISLFLAIWSRLQYDCTEMMYWLKGRGDAGVAPPPCVLVYVEQGKSLYTGIENALDVFVAAFDPSCLTQLRGHGSRS